MIQVIKLKELFSKLPPVKTLPAVIWLVISICALMIAIAMKPVKNYTDYPSDLENNIPKAFGEWSLAPVLIQQVSLASDNNMQNQVYDDVLMRTYINKQGEKVMLALAYVKEQRQDVKVHQPDNCYPAQGFQMLQSELTTFKIDANKYPIIGKNQVYMGSTHREAVSYWIRVGDDTFLSGLQMRLKTIKDGVLKQRFDDGMLVRVSSELTADEDTKKLFHLHERFLNDLTASVTGNKRRLLVPAGV